MKVKDVFNAVIGIAGIALSVGVVIIAIAIAAALTVHGWPSGDWALGWTALSAIGGLAAGSGAFYAARVAIKTAKQQEQKENNIKRVEAEIASYTLAPQLRLVKNQLDQCLQMLKQNEWEDLNGEIDILMKLLNGLDNQDIRHFAYLRPQIANKLSEAKSYINGFYEKSYGGNEKLTGDVKARIFLASANGHEILENYCQYFSKVSVEMFKLNSIVRSKS